MKRACRSLLFLLVMMAALITPFYSHASSCHDYDYVMSLCQHDLNRFYYNTSIDDYPNNYVVVEGCTSYYFPPAESYGVSFRLRDIQTDYYFWEGGNYYSCPANFVPPIYRKNAGGIVSNGGNGGGAGKRCLCEGSPSRGRTVTADPVNVANGNKYIEEEDYIDPGGWLTFRRFYNSAIPMLASPMGFQWRHSFDRSLQITGSPATSIMELRPDGTGNEFTKSNGVWVTDPDIADRLTEIDDAQGTVTGYSLFVADARQTETYSADGLLQSVVDATGQGITLSYSTASTPTTVAPHAGMLLSVTDAKGRHLGFAYTSGGWLDHVTLPDQTTLTYAYDTINRLISVTFPDDSTRTYAYNESGYADGGAFTYSLTGIKDETGARYESTFYDNYDRVTDAQLAGQADDAAFTYNSDGTTTVQYALGASVTMGFSTIQGVDRVSSVDQSCGLSCDKHWKTRTYDANGYPKTSTDFGGHTTTTTYGGAGLLTQNVEATGTAEQRTTNLTWDTDLRVPLARNVLDASGNTVQSTQWVYNTRGQVLAKCDIDDAQASSYTCAATGTPPAGVRRWTYTYCDAVDTTQCPLVGLTLSATGPRTDLTQTTAYSYYLDSATTGCTTPGGACHQPGDLHTVTDALGHVTSIDSYDADGRITRTTDPNGVHTDLTYTPRGWLASRSVGGATTSFTYKPYGAVASITDPDGVTIGYTYDDAHRLTDITDAQGNSIHYTLDAAGNKTEEQVFDSTGTALRTTSRTFNTLGELTSVVDGLNHTVFNASFSDSYDADGNLVHSANGLSIEKKMGYDALNRLDSVIRNYNGADTDTANTQSTMAYDAMDRVTGVTDPDNLSTIYTYNGLGDRTSLQSPGTGTSSDTYDAAGNRLTHTDAKGQVDTSTYDALDRLATQQYADSTLDVAYYYDEADSVTGCSGSYPVGRLTRIVKGDTTTTYCYDAHGNVTKKTQNQNGTLASVAYGYTSGDRLQSVTYPDGTEADYAYDSDGRVQSLSLIPPDHTQATALAAVSGIRYLPFGPIASYTLGNGQTITRSYDADYRLTDLTSPLLNLHYARDALGNITAMGSAPGANPASESYGYDPLQRLKAVTESDGSTLESYTYNKTGDRLSKTGSGQATGAYSYAANTHHLIEVGTAPYSVDADGETTSMQRAGTTYSFTYNARQRMATAQEGAGTPVAYAYNALGERIRKTANATVTDRFQYDEASHLLSRSRTDGTRDYIWLGSLPVAVVDQPAANGASTESYVVADDLGSPRVVTDASGNQIWSWAKQGNPFGEQQPTSGSGFVFNMRFPGQYYDEEAGLAYNLNRDLDAETGRYLEDDPLGLSAGFSVYTYVLGNPLNYMDVQGLCKNDECDAIKEKIMRIRDELAKREGDLINNKYGLPPSGPMSIGGHQQQFENKQVRLRKLLNDYNSNGCDDGLPADVWDYATKPAPGPTAAGGSKFMQKMSQLTGLTGKALIIYIAISEGTRLFPPRDLLPMP